MTIKNKTKKTVLASNACFITTEKERIKGLIGEKKSKTIVFETRFGIHTFFMKFPIDVSILNESNEVVALKGEMKPNRIFVWNPKHKLVTELPTGTLRKTQTEVGDKITMKQ